MATDQEVLKARTFRVATSLRDSEYSAADANWYRTKMRTLLNAHRYIHGTLESVWLSHAPGQDFMEYLTPWEREWSVLARSYVGGFTPIVDENGTVIAHRGVTGTYDSTPLIAPYGDLLYTLPEQTIRTLKEISDVGIVNKDLLQLLKDGANVFVHDRAKTLPPDWRRLRYSPAETKLTLMVSVDGQLFDFVPSMTGFLKEGYSPMDILAVGQVLATLGKTGTRYIRALVRKAMPKVEARKLLDGATVELAKKAAKTVEPISRGPGALARRMYEPNPKHEPGGWGSRAPKNPQGMLDESVEVPVGRNATGINPRAPHRIVYDFENKEIVVFRRHTEGVGSHPDVYHGYVVEWNKLDNLQTATLVKAGYFKHTGKPVKEPP